MMSGSPVLGALELAGKHTKLAAARGLQLSRRWRSVRTWRFVRSRTYVLHASAVKLLTTKFSTVVSGYRCTGFLVGVYSGMSVG